MATNLRLVETISLNATSGSGTDIDVATALGGIPNYFLMIYPAGDVCIYEPGTDSKTTLNATQFASGVKDFSPGPLKALDGSYRLWAASTTACVIDVWAVTGEG